MQLPLRSEIGKNHVIVRQASFFNTYAVEGANRIAGKLSFVILNLSFEIFEDEFFIFLDKFCWILMKITKFNTFLINFRGQNMKIAGNLSFGKNISLVLLKNWLSFEFFRVFFALSFVKMLKKEAWTRHRVTMQYLNSLAKLYHGTAVLILKIDTYTCIPIPIL